MRHCAHSWSFLLVFVFVLALSLVPGLVRPAFAQDGQTSKRTESADSAPSDVAALQMEWNTSAPNPLISALSDECDKRFPGKSHTCDVISHERKQEKALLRATPPGRTAVRKSLSADVILASDFGRRGKIVCQMDVPESKIRHPQVLPWLTIVKMQELFEAENLGTEQTRPWTCAMQKCEDGNCRKLGNPKLLVDRL